MGVSPLLWDGVGVWETPRPVAREEGSQEMPPAWGWERALVWVLVDGTQRAGTNFGTHWLSCNALGWLLGKIKSTVIGYYSGPLKAIYIVISTRWNSDIILHFSLHTTCTHHGISIFVILGDTENWLSIV